MDTIVVSGAAGFVGRQLVETLAAQHEQVVAIARKPQPSAAIPNVSWIAADLLQPERYEPALRDARAVLHLAGATGKARPRVYQRDNVTATAVLLAAAERARVRRFVLVSSIAAVFSDRRHYPYAESKIAAEQLVRASSLPTTVVRPTMILGAGSPIQRSLELLARLPVIPLFGDGQRRVQPVDVADVVKLLAALAREQGDTSAVLELGGPEVYTLQTLLVRLRALQGKADRARFLRLPLQLLRFVLALLEPPLLAALPITAGQLATFANDGVASDHPLVQRLLHERRSTPHAALAPVAAS